MFSSVTQSCPTLCDPMNCSTPGLPVHHQLPEFTQTHVHRVSDTIQPSHPRSSPSPPAPNPSQHQSPFQLGYQSALSLGEGNGSPLQYSCLKNPVDGGAWWAAVHRVSQSRARLRRLSMHGCIGEGNGNPLQHSCLENTLSSSSSSNHTDS